MAALIEILTDSAFWTVYRPPGSYPKTGWSGLATIHELIWPLPHRLPITPHLATPQILCEIAGAARAARLRAGKTGNKGPAIAGPQRRSVSTLAPASNRKWNRDIFDLGTSAGNANTIRERYHPLAGN